MDDRMEEFRAAVTIGTGRLSDDKAAGFDDGQELFIAGGRIAGIRERRAWQARCGVGWIQEIEHGIRRRLGG
jgi:hypothetical protein